MTHRPEPFLSDAAAGTPIRVLVADDDAASRRFLLDALQVLGATVTPAADGIEALMLARSNAFDLLLLDCRMPGAGGEDVLAALRNDAHSLSHHAVAVATTAEPDPADHDPLRACGFSDILVKPCRLADLRRTLQLAPHTTIRLPVLDDAAALLATGDSNTMQALRQLLQQELSTLWDDLEPLTANPAAFGDRLHRLRSSCGFCGASALADRVVMLQKEMSRPGSDAGPALDDFREAIMQTLRALEQPEPLA